MDQSNAESVTEVYVWGSDTWGQLGLGSRTGKTYSWPVTCSYGIRVAQVACGEEHAALLTPEGRLFTMGSNADGRLGIGDRSIHMQAVPTPVSELAEIRVLNVSCGGAHTAAVTSSGDLFTWGLGRTGALGTGGSLSQWTPHQVAFPSGFAVQSVSCGGRHTAVVIKEPEGKTVHVFGAGEAGQLGLGRKESELAPKRVLFDEEIEQVAAGVFHTLFLMRNNQVYATGDNGAGQLGTGTHRSVKRPVIIEGLSGLTVVQVACANHSAAVTREGRLYIWGSGVFGEYLSPQRIKTAAEVSLVSIGSSFGALVDTRNGLWTWGSNAHGQLGHGDNDTRNVPFPILSLKDKPVRVVACGGSFVIALGDNLPKVSNSARFSRTKAFLNVSSSENVSAVERGLNHTSLSLEDLGSQTRLIRSFRSEIDSRKVLELELFKEQQLRLAQMRHIDVLRAEIEQLRDSATHAQTALARVQREAAWSAQNNLQLTAQIQSLSNREKERDVLDMKKADVYERELSSAQQEIAQLESELAVAQRGKSVAEKQAEKRDFAAEISLQNLAQKQADLEAKWTLRTQEDSSKYVALESEIQDLRKQLLSAKSAAAKSVSEIEGLKGKLNAAKREAEDRNEKVKELVAVVERQEMKNKALVEALEREVWTRAGSLTRAKAAVSTTPESRRSVSPVNSILEKTTRLSEESRRKMAEGAKRSNFHKEKPAPEVRIQTTKQRQNQTHRT